MGSKNLHILMLLFARVLRWHPSKPIQVPASPQTTSFKPIHIQINGSRLSESLKFNYNQNVRKSHAIANDADATPISAANSLNLFDVAIFWLKFGSIKRGLFASGFTFSGEYGVSVSRLRPNMGANFSKNVTN